MGNRKYPKTTGHYNYCHILPNKMCYFGKSSQQPYYRWQPSRYKNTVLGPYIEEIGWDNIEHIVIQDGLTKRQSEVLEDWFIKNAKLDGFCINDRRSGGRWRDNPNKCHREYEKTEKRKEYRREYSKTKKYKEYQRQYRLKKETTK